MEQQPSRSASKAIKAIERSAVHRICSGQVIIDLAGAVKELLENSLDASATAVDIKLRGFGANSIEVSDNGTGVSPENYEGLTRKYCTSKLRDFSDLQHVSTFGFRGEALSSLCALAKLTVCTRTSTESVGTLLTYNSEGEIEKKTPKARSVGTTVMLTSLFEGLPVRHREFQKNIKKEFTKLVNLLQAYAIICNNVRITCQNEKGGKWTRVIGTNGKEMRDNIISVFGSSLNQQLLSVSKGLVFQTSKVKKTVSMYGFISKPERNTGRNNGNRQYIFVNNRPIDYPKLTKMMNEIYRQANPNQYPIVFLNFTMPTDYYDVNVTPDKRTILMHDEQSFLEVVKSVITEEYAIGEQHAFQKNIFGSLTNFEDAFDEMNPTRPAAELEEEDHTDAGETSTHPTDYRLQRQGSQVSHLRARQASDEEKEQEKELHKRQGYGKDEEMMEEEGEKESERGMLMDEDEQDEEKENAHAPTHDGNSTNSVTDDPFAALQRPSPLNRFAFASSSRLSLSPGKLNRTFSAPSKIMPLTKEPVNEGRGRGRGRGRGKGQERDDQRRLYGEGEEYVYKIQKGNGVNDKMDVGLSNGEGGGSLPSYSVISKKRKAEEVLQKIALSIKSSQGELDRLYTRKKLKMSRDGENADAVSTEEGEGSQVVYINDGDQLLLQHLAPQSNELDQEDGLVINVQLEDIIKRKALHQQRRKEALEQDRHAAVRFSANLESEGTEAEEELRRVFNKEDFEKMRVVGQFNLGFIIARSGDDIFIVDQHASDEKFNFETLQKTTTINTQRLICPKALELTAIEEATVTEHMWVFNKNGFFFVADEEGKLKLSAIPYSKNKEFGVEDVHELIAQLDEFPGEMCRLSRVSAMFASRACRMSIMIGTALSAKEMQRVLSNMATIENPWSCPHGRPTMRHLFSISTLMEQRKKEETKAKEKAMKRGEVGLVQRIARMTIAAKRESQGNGEKEKEN